MPRPAVAALAVLALGSACRVHGADPQTVQVKLNGQTFTLPAGFTVELAAGPPLVNRPVAASFDDRGHLFVTEASGTNDPVQKQLAQKPHSLLRLTDADGDGRFEAGGVFADKLMLPQGVMWRDGAVYVGHPPVITKFADTTGRGVADRRDTWFDGKTLTGCGNDLHGPYPGPDGWVYWTKGAFAKQTYTLPTGRPLVTRAAHVFRARPDGTGVEPVMTGGMDNPVDVVFTPGGERIFSTTFFQHPANGRRDGLVHAIYGGVYGKDHDPVSEHPWTGPDLMPVMTHMGAAAPCGLHRYDGPVGSNFGVGLGEGYFERCRNVFCASFNLHKVTRHVLVPDGATFRTSDSDFLVSDSLDFHPTDVIEDANGDLLVVDTGGWYKLCCPTSQLVKPDVLGAIYRVRRVGALRDDDPLGLKVDLPGTDTSELNHYLEDARAVVRRRAVEEYARRGEAGLRSLGAHALNTNFGDLARLNAVWALGRIGSPAALKQVRYSFADDTPEVRQAALHVAALHRDKAAVPDLVKVLRHKDPHARRAAAEALGRIGDKAAVPALLAALREPADRVLHHSLTYALIEIGDPAGTAGGLADPAPAVRRSALIALDGMPGGGLRAETAVAELAAADPGLRETAWAVVGRHPDWGDAVTGYFRAKLRAVNLSDADRSDLTARLAKLGKSAAVGRFLAEAIADPGLPPAARRAAVRAAAAAGVRQPPAAWFEAVAKVLTEGPAELAGDAVALARALPAPKAPPAGYADALLKAGRDPGVPPETRFGALAAVPGGLPAVDPGLFADLLGAVHRDRPVPVRSAAADALARAALAPDQLVALAAALPAAGPMELDRLLDPFARSSDDRAGLALVAALKEPRARAGLRADMLRPRLAKYGPPVREAAEGLIAGLTADAAGQRARLEELLAGLAGGDARRGQAVFHSPMAACATCHQMGYLGGKVGPDLTQVGKVRTERDLVEAVAFPSASFVRSYEPVRVATHDGRTYTGVLKADAPDEVVLAVSATDEVRVARKDIDEMTPGAVSVMPSGLDQQLTRQELADLIAFLKASR